jgi:hypothetical protein
MFEELVEKIKASEKFVYAGDPTTSTSEKVLRSEFNRGLNKAIDIITASEPQWLDTPTEEGWWWFCFKRCKPEMQLIGKDSFGNFVGKQDNAPDYDIKSFKGTWIKALMPK